MGGAGGPSGTWSGVSCAAPAQDEPVRPYFEIPGAAAAEPGDFFRLPFPNDLLRSERGLDLTGFPTPGVGVLGFDVVQLYVDAVAIHDTAFGSDPTTYFRFSGALDPRTLDPRTSLHYVDVTPDPTGVGARTPTSSARGTALGFRHHYSHERTRYVCEDWLGVRLEQSSPLLSGHTYAVWITTDVAAEDGTALEPSPLFQSVLAEEEPAEPALAAAWDAYAPLRDYLTEQDIDPATLASAAVFTVADLTRSMEELAAAVEAEPVPRVTGDWVLCDEGVTSPCPDHSRGRDCPSANALYDEYHAVVALPSYQRGTQPFVNAGDGGGIDVSEPAEFVDVCLALTVPKSVPPEAGFPLVVFAHGTGGSFREHATPEIAGALASAEAPSAVLGIDQLAHGTRRAGSATPPENLFFNFQNPEAARGNPLQGAADQLALARFAAALDGSGEEPVRIDPERIVFFGHSQGATVGSLALPFAEGYRGAVLSGNGGSLQRALLTKTNPVALRDILPVLLNDPPFASDDYREYHPVLALLQQWIDPADPLNFARHAAMDPLPGHSPRHAFQTYGLRDTFSPPSTLDAYALAGGFAQVGPELAPLGLEIHAPPLAGNVDGITLGFRQYAPETGQDGHFVVFEVPEANADVVRFLSQAASGAIPEIGE